MTQTACPCCQSSALEAFFTIRNAPIQSIVAIKDYESAMRVPRNDIVLTLCNDCGFIFNSEFNTEWDYYTQGYEDQQGFSATFVEFLKGVTQRFIDKYDLRDKLVVEVGCGKGDFIRLICDLGPNEGIGIDPAWVPGRAPDRPDVSFIREFYTRDNGAIPADCIACRHTLEHIHNADEFMSTIRDCCQDTSPVLFFEVPCMLRILKDRAFWDIFNEHCCYFTPGSLARLFRRGKFEVLDLYLEYQDQYLFIEGRPVESPDRTPHRLEEGIDELKEMTRVFVDGINTTLDSWRKRLLRFKEEGKRVVIWGGGSKSVGFLTQFDEIGLIEHVVDINPHLLGNFIPGIGIQYVGPDFLSTYRPDVVIVMNSVYIPEIKKDLQGMGVSPEVIGL